MPQFLEEVARGERFEFGKNWAQFLARSMRAGFYALNRRCRNAGDARISAGSAFSILVR